MFFTMDAPHQSFTIPDGVPSEWWVNVEKTLEELEEREALESARVTATAAAESVLATDDPT